jgi:hypothetical protein
MARSCDALLGRYCVMETALDCAAMQLPVCVVMDGSRYYR